MGRLCNGVVLERHLLLWRHHLHCSDGGSGGTGSCNSVGVLQAAIGWLGRVPIANKKLRGMLQGPVLSSYSWLSAAHTVHTEMVGGMSMHGFVLHMQHTWTCNTHAAQMQHTCNTQCTDTKGHQAGVQLPPKP